MNRVRWLVAAALLSGGAFAGEAPQPPDAAGIWKSKCKGCHGPDGRAQTKTGRKEKIDDFTAASWQSESSDDFIRRVITHGSKDNRKMKAYEGKLTPQEIDSLVVYIRGLKGPGQ